MSAPYMPSKVTLILGTKGAVRAGERRVSSVGPQMDVKRTSIIVGLRTEGTLVEFVGVR